MHTHTHTHTCIHTHIHTHSRPPTHTHIHTHTHTHIQGTPTYTHTHTHTHTHIHTYTHTFRAVLGEGDASRIVQKPLQYVYQMLTKALSGESRTASVVLAISDSEGKEDHALQVLGRGVYV